MNPRYRKLNVDTSPIIRLYDEMEAAGFSAEAGQVLIREYPRELAKLRRQAMLRPVPVNGNRALGRRQGYFETVLRDGTLGYFQRRLDDCFQASMASLAQVPMHQVPDPRIDRELASGLDPEELGRVVAQQFIQWAEQHGLTILKFSEPPTSAERWVGVASNGANPWHDHCLVDERGRVLVRYIPLAATTQAQPHYL